MSSEQKVILGIVSMRQLIYLIIGGSILYTIIPFIWNFLGPLPFTVKVVLCFIAALPVLAIILPLAFYKKGKYGMFLDYYLLVKLGSKTQIGTWRKGFKPQKWMEEIE